MSGNVLVNFRLDRDHPLRVRWLATDGVPGDGYKPQVTAVVLPDGTRLAMHGTSIMEQVQPDAGGGIGAYMIVFTGVVGYADGHADRGHVDKLDDAEIDYELEFVHEDGRIAVADRDYQIIDRPRGIARRLSGRDA